MRIAVVGAGLVGLSTAWALSRAGHEAVVLEQGPLPNPDAASHDEHRLIRYAYGGERGYCRMVRHAFEAWERLWKDLGERHYAETGALSLGYEDGDWTALSRRDMEHQDIEFEVLDRQQMAEAAPALAVPDGAWGLYNREGGLLFVERILKSLAAKLERQGVDLRAESPVARVRPGEVTLQSGEVVKADGVVLAAGAWAGQIEPELSRIARPYRQCVVYLQPPAAQAENWTRMPILVQLSNGGDLYTAPPRAGTGLKVGHGEHRRPGDPDAPRHADAAELNQVAGQFRPFFKDFADYRPITGKVCFYSMSQDQKFVPLDRPGLVGITGCSGHMAKFGALMGERLAARITGEKGSETFSDWARGQLQYPLDRRARMAR